MLMSTQSFLTKLENRSDLKHKKTQNKLSGVEQTFVRRVVVCMRPVLKKSQRVYRSTYPGVASALGVGPEDMVMLARQAA